MFSAEEKRARSTWLLAFGDVITLLITFFILLIALNQTQASRLQQWGDEQLRLAYAEMAEQLANQDLQMISLKRTPQGIWLQIHSAQAFAVGDYRPSQSLLEELNYLGILLQENRLFRLAEMPQEQAVLAFAAQQGLEWHAEISIEGHTDNTPILANSPLYNNWFLSTMRAQAVFEPLQQSSQLAAHYFVIAGLGEHQPLAKNDNDAARQRNRRIDLFISAGFSLRQVGAYVAP